MLSYECALPVVSSKEGNELVSEGDMMIRVATLLKRSMESSLVHGEKHKEEENMYRLRCDGETKRDV